MNRMIIAAFSIMTSGAVACNSAAADDFDPWQTQQLMQPAEYMLLAEANGRVNIYDGLPVEVVEKALDAQFDRIDHMMFTRIRHTGPQGEITEEDDGC